MQQADEAQKHEMLAVALDKVRFSWPGALHDTLDIPHFSMSQAERVFVSGPSGCGKSTLLGLIAGILTPTCGQVLVQGTALESLGSAGRDRFRGEHIGFIFQQFNLVPYLSVVENVLIPCRFSALRRKRAEKQGSDLGEVAAMLLQRLDLEKSLWRKPVRTLSIGQQQRVACARALIGQPELIIADEPTSALDTDRRVAFLHLLLEECTSQGTALLFVSHDELLAEAFPRTVRMQDINLVKGEES
ncbi:MAG: ABC transporter ATP-binding protein [Desulfovibrio sp.]|nr:ABC transporter ATP-binding protein [Desulfovibrio sp.]